MLKRALVATVATLSALPAVFAATPTFTGIFGQVVTFLGPQGMDLLFAFGIVSALMYMAISNVPFFKEGAAAKAGGALFAIIAGLATGFYVYTTKFPFLATIGTYFMLLVAIMLGLILLYVVKGLATGEASLAGSLGISGIGALFIGILIAVFSSALSWLGILIAVIGAFLMVIGGASWMTGKGELGIFKTNEKKTKSMLGDIEDDYSEDVRTVKQFELAQTNLSKKLGKILDEVVEEIKASNPAAAIQLLQSLEGIVNTEFNETQQERTNVQALLTKLRARVRPKIRDLENREIRKQQEEQYDKQLRILEGRAEAIDTWRLKVEELVEEFEKKGILRIKACIESIQMNNFAMFNENVAYLRALFARIENTVYRELNVANQYEGILRELEKIEQLKLNYEEVGGNIEKKLKSAEDVVITELSKLKIFLNESKTKTMGIKDKKQIQNMEWRINSVEKIISIMERPGQTSRQKLVELTREEHTIEELDSNLRAMKEPWAREAQRVIHDIFERIEAIKQLLRTESRE